MAKRNEVIDEDGNALAPPEPGSPMAVIIYLMEYGRKRGFRIGPQVQVGDTIVEVLDLRQQQQLSRAQLAEKKDLEPGSDMAILLGGDDQG